MIFKNKGWLSGLAKGVTDLGGYADVIMQGGSLNKNDLTNKEIDELVKHYKMRYECNAFWDNSCGADEELAKMHRAEIHIICVKNR